MTTTFVHIGDIHLGPNGREAERLRVLDQIIGKARQMADLGAFLIPGDIHHARSTPDTRNAFADRLVQMASLAPTILAYGNHDQVSELEIFGRLHTTWPIYVVSGPEVLRLALPNGQGAAVAVLPYPSRGGLIAAGSTADETLQEAYVGLEAIVRSFALELNDAVADGLMPLFIGHVAVSGALASNLQPQIGREMSIDKALLDLLGPIYKGLSHIHLPQEIGGAWYAGSISPCDFGEQELKRFLVVHYHRVDSEDWRYDVESWPIDTPRLFRARGELTRDGFTLEPSAEYPESWAGCEVKVTYSFLASERNVLDHNLVRIPFEGALRLEVEPVAVPDRALRAPEVAAAHTLAAKVAAWASFSGATVSDGVPNKLAQLEHQDATATLSAVATRIAAIEHAEKSEKAA
jgi:hypothetical protein